MIDLSTLNENQFDAVQWDDGPLLVLAGPGSGKTRVLTYRIARLIEASPDKYFKILGLTFTNAAAAGMRQRIAELVPSASERTLLTTFHSFAADLLRQHGHHIGLMPDFTILSQDADRHSLLDEAIDGANVEDLHHDIAAKFLYLESNEDIVDTVTNAPSRPFVLGSALWPKSPRASRTLRRHHQQVTLLV